MPTDARPHRLLDRFGLVLVLVLVSIVAGSLIDVHDSAVGQFVTHAVTGAALVTATRASGARRRLRVAMDAFVAVSVLGNLVVVLLGGAPVNSPLQPDALWFLAAAVTPVLVANRVARHETVRLQTVLGAVAAYLQVAVAYALLFQTVDAATPGPFFGEDVSTTVYMYVSLSTIATLGYGDYTPVTDLGRLAAMTEAVIGQVYLVTFVAMIVSRFAAAPVGSNRPPRLRRRGAPPDPPADPGPASRP